MRLLLIFLIFNYSFPLKGGPFQNYPSFVLKTGEQAKVGNLVVKFEEVLSDSRCPEGVTCIRAGEAKVLVTIYRGNRLLGEEILTLTKAGSQISQLKNYLSGEDLQMVSGYLEPYPVIGKKTAIGEYLLNLQFIEKEAEEHN